MTHIFPLNEQHMHKFDTHCCPCVPEVQIENDLVIHRRFSEIKHEHIEVPLSMKIDRLISECGMIP